MPVAPERTTTHLPIRIAVINGDFVPSFDALGGQHDTLLAQPNEPLELRIWLAGMVDEAGVIALLALPDLVRGPIRLADHDIHALKTRGNETHEFSDRPALFERTAGYEAIVLAVWRAEDLDWYGAGLGRAICVRVAFTAVLCWVVGLVFVAVLTLEQGRVVISGYGARVVGRPGLFIDDRLADMSVREVAIPLMVGLWPGKDVSIQVVIACLRSKPPTMVSLHHPGHSLPNHGDGQCICAQSTLR